MNNVVLIGRLTKDPELRWSNDNVAIARFSLAINRIGKDKGADFPSIVVFSKQAENCEKYLTKGRKVAIQGHIQTGSYEKDGRKVYTTDVVADRVEFLEWGDREEKPTSNSGTFEGFEAVEDDDVPF